MKAACGELFPFKLNTLTIAFWKVYDGSEIYKGSKLKLKLEFSVGTWVFL